MFHLRILWQCSKPWKNSIINDCLIRFQFHIFYFDIYECYSKSKNYYYEKVFQNNILYNTYNYAIISKLRPK